MATTTTPQTARLIEAVISRVMFENDPRLLIDVSHVRATKTGYSARVVAKRQMFERRYVARVNTKTGKVNLKATSDPQGRKSW